MSAQLYFLLYCPSVFGTAGLSGNSHPRPQALRPTRPVHTELSDCDMCTEIQYECQSRDIRASAFIVYQYAIINTTCILVSRTNEEKQNS